jgi:hypothetical protein
VLTEEATNTNFIVFGWSNPRSVALEASTLTITPPMRLQMYYMFNSSNSFLEIVVSILQLYINIKKCGSCFHDASQEMFGDTKEVIRIRKSEKDRQHNGQKK